MKTIYKNIIWSAAVGLALTSCSSDENGGVSEPQAPQATSFNLQKMAEFRCSSNDIVLDGTYNYLKVQDWENAGAEHRPAVYNLFADKAPKKGNGEAVADVEKDFVLQYLADHPDEGSTDFDHYNYFIQYVGGSHDVYKLDFIADDGSVHHSQDITGSNQMDYIRFVDQNGEVRHINDYNANSGARALVLNCNIAKAVYHDSYANLEYDSKYRFYTIENVPQGDGTTATGYYLCFDYATSKYDNGQGTLEGDGKYNDYVIKITPGCGGVDPVNPDPVDPDPVDPTPDPDEPVVVVNNGHVEVNLAAQDHKDEESSKLTVHVRDTCNFKVFIPVSDQYYCSADDMYIVEKHYENMTYNDLSTVVEREVNGQKVTLSITYAAEGIYIESAGINAKVLEYCRNVYGDGITFEVWNYYNSSITRDMLITLLNQSTITFTDNEPKEYIVSKPLNGDGTYKNVDSEGRLLDCTVEKK